MNYATLIWHRLNRMNRIYTQSTEEKLEEHGLSEAIADILGRIHEQPGMTQTELSEKLLVTQGNIAQLVKKMESCDLIFRERDGRSKQLYLTAKGEATYAEVVEFLQCRIDAFLNVLDQDEQKQLLSLLGKVDRARRDDYERHHTI